MTREEIAEVVAVTVRELGKTGYLRRFDDVAYSRISNRLYDYYTGQSEDKDLADAIDQIKGHYYFSILPQYYKDRLTIDWIAESYHCDAMTIKRNKKQLCLRIWNILDEKGAI